MKTDFECVGEFHRKFGLQAECDIPAPRLLDPVLSEFRVKFIQEELAEYVKATAEGNLSDAADALVDLVYVVLGTAHLHGFPWDSLFATVHEANMKKERAAVDGSNSKRQSSFDVVKPEGWQPPDIQGVLGRHVNSRRAHRESCRWRQHGYCHHSAHQCNCY